MRVKVSVCTCKYIHASRLELNIEGFKPVRRVSENKQIWIRLFNQNPIFHVNRFSSKQVQATPTNCEL